MSDRQQPKPWFWIEDLLRTSSRRPEERKIGVEIERIGIWPDGSSLHYGDRAMETGDKRIGAGTLLRGLELTPRWAVIQNDQGHPLGFTTPLGKVSLEPGSQLELSTNPCKHIAELIKNVTDFDEVLFKVSRPAGLSWIGLGTNPLEPVDAMDVIPSTRYQIMTDYLGKRGKLGTSMMRLTTSVQINLDYTSEQEAIEMLRVALAVTPVSYALFANSPLLAGKETGYLSYRRMIWKDTDPDRTGLLHAAFDLDFDLGKYAELIWKQPLMFAQNAKRCYVAAGGLSLAQLALDRLPGVTADETNQFNAIREFFTEARLKPGYVEVRSIDGLRACDRYAATAFWTGLLYSSGARQIALELVGRLSAGEREEATLAAAKTALACKVGGRPMHEVASELVRLAEQSLRARGFGEEKYLDPIKENLQDGVSPAERVLHQFRGAWGGRMAPLVEYSAQ